MGPPEYKLTSPFAATLLFVRSCVCYWTLMPLENFYLQDISHLPISNKGTALNIQEAYLKETQIKFQYPTVVKLNDHLKQVSSALNCFTVIDNFHGMDLDESEIPVVLRRPIPFVYKKIMVVWTWSTAHLNNVSVFVHAKNLTCSVSKFLSSFQFVYDDICLRINMTTYFRSAKPFQCHVLFKLFPITYLTYSKNYLISPQVFQIRMKNTHMEIATPPTIPPITCIFRVHQQSQNLSALFTEFMKWVNRKSLEKMNTYLYPYYQEIFVLFSIGRVQKRKLIGQESIRDYETIEVLKVCPACLSENGKLGGLTRIRIKYLNLKILTSISFTRAHEKHYWSAASDHSGDGNLHTPTFQHMRSCKVYSASLWENIRKEKSVIDKVAVGHSYVWKSMMGNFSFVMADIDPDCKILGQAEVTIDIAQFAFIRPYFVYPYYPPDYLSSLRFVGCGRRGLSTIPFMELIRVFEGPTWLAIFLTMLIVLTFMRFLFKNIKAGASTTSILKVLLEQGDPIPPCITLTKKHRYFIGTFLLVGIVLSNAYKSSNVYNMVIPRSPILYKLLTDLLRDKIDMYSRSYYLTTGTGLTMMGYERLNVTIVKSAIFLASEVKTRLERYKSIMRELPHRDKNFVDKSVELTQALKLYPKVVSNFTSLFKKHIPKQPFNFLAVRQAIVSLFRNSQPTETMIMQEALEECQRRAFVVPHYICGEIYLNLASRKKISDVYVGEESYLGIDWLFYFRGIVPPYLIKRIHQMAESGVWLWWMRILEGSKLDTTNSHRVEAAKMTGNIIVIFVVWTGGIGLSLVSFLIEHVKFEEAVCCKQIIPQQFHFKRRLNVAKYKIISGLRMQLEPKLCIIKCSHFMEII